jgi:hypothetical protein
MLSKCANPECFETFRFLHQGRLFRLDPTPAVASAATSLGFLLYERFWLCDLCAQSMTVAWNGKHANVVPISSAVHLRPLLSDLPRMKGSQRVGSDFLRRRAAAAGGSD